jgi:hypothetical protein
LGNYTLETIGDLTGLSAPYKALCEQLTEQKTDKQTEITAAQEEKTELEELKASVNRSLYTRPISDKLRKIFEYQKELKDQTLFLSVHSNSTDQVNGTVSGTMNYFVQPSTTDRSPYGVYTHQYDTSARYNASIKIASATARAAGTKLVSGGTMNDNNICILRETNLVSTLVEMAYINNASDRAKLTSPAYQQRFANGIVQGVYDYFGT